MGSLRAKGGPSRAACRLRDWRAALARGSFPPRSQVKAYPASWSLDSGGAYCMPRRVSVFSHASIDSVDSADCHTAHGL